MGKIAFIGLLLLAAIIVVTGIMSRQANSEQVAEWTQARLIPAVSVTQPVTGEATQSLTLAGRLQAFKQASIYARVDGYVKEWHHDIGALVTEGEVLAELDTPELDQQLIQAQADVDRFSADVALARSTLDRWKKLVATNAVTAQELEQRENSYRAAQAQLASAKANVNRLQVQNDLAMIPAPFDGVVVARNKDIGDLINAGSDDSEPLFMLASTHPLRLNVQVPQKFARQIQKGTQAEVSVPESPGSRYEAEVVRSNSAVDRHTGTMLVQLILDNQDNSLLPGGYASVNLPLSANAAMLTVPVSALIFNANGLSVATVSGAGDNTTVSLKAIEPGRDLGRDIEIASGIDATDRVITNPPDGIENGDVVRVVNGQQS